MSCRCGEIKGCVEYPGFLGGEEVATRVMIVFLGRYLISRGRPSKVLVNERDPINLLLLFVIHIAIHSY